MAGRHEDSARATSSTGTRSTAARERQRERRSRTERRITKGIGALALLIERELKVRGSLPCAGDDRRRRLPGRKRTQCAVCPRTPRTAGASRRHRRRDRARRAHHPPRRRRGTGHHRLAGRAGPRGGADRPRPGRPGAVPRDLHRAAGAVRPQRGGRHRLPRLGPGPGPSLPRHRAGPSDRLEPRALHREHALTAGAPEDGHFYFVNSYYCAPDDHADALGLTDYTVEFCSVVARGNVVATQFHAEKSGPLGLSLLRNFAAWEPVVEERPC